EIAARSRLAVGSIYSEQGDLTKAISTFEGVVTDYPGTQFAKDAQYQSFRLRGREADKSFSQVDLRQQREAGEDFITQFGSDPRATDIKASLGKLEDKELEKSFDVGRFYERQGNLHAAVIYYREVVAHPGAKSYNDAKKRLEQIVQRDPTLAAVAAGQRKPMTETGGGLPIPPKPGNSAQFMGPPPPTMENSKPRMRTSTDEVLPIPSDDPTAAN
ncbi:MAG: tetratricopeptide repeat protein, partial [Verrucomicrobiae bacterium]|nr:tetratricopeptide repeat protein [Verrucomicrobiae bacterium]